MARTPSIFAADPWRSFISLLLVVTQVGFSIPPAKAASSASSQRASRKASPGARSIALDSAWMKLSQLQTRVSLAAKAAASALNPPSEFARLKSQFEEPLIATAPTSSREDAELLKAIKTYESRTAEDDFHALTKFLKDHPHSGWRVALLSNLGLLDYHYGYFSRAITSWEEAWEEGRNASELRARRLVDRTVGELARMHARLGHTDRIEALLKEIGDRPISGQATEAIAGAKEGLWVMQNKPGVAYLCGPFALRNLLASMKVLTSEDRKTIEAYQSSKHGVTLSQLSELADKIKLPHRVVFRSAGEAVPVPSVIHWKVSHFAALVGEENGRFHLMDPTFGDDLWITRTALEAESSGYFLVPTQNTIAALRRVDSREASQVRGMGTPASNDPNSLLQFGDILCVSCLVQGALSTVQQVFSATTPESNPNQNGGMVGYNMHEMLVSLHLTDTPVGYKPPIGPGAYVSLVYNQREASQPANFTYFNVSQKWTLNWLAFVVDDPRSPAANISRYAAGGGVVPLTGYVNATGSFTPETRDASVVTRVSASPVRYERQLADGSKEVYGQADNAATYPRRIFLTQIVDPAGNATTLHYDAQLRLTSFTDATGRDTVFSYQIATMPLLVTKITDPFGRSAEIAYDASGRLIQITDTLGIKSQFAYDAFSLVDAMKTPYGTTKFAYATNGNQRILEATDPLNHTEHLEYRQVAPGIPYSDPANTIPVGLPAPFNAYLYGRDTFYWDKHAFPLVGGDYTKARNRHWTHEATNGNLANHTVESIKYPLENRVWMYYPGESSTGFSGTYDQPSVFGRVLDDGTTQLYQQTYNTQGHVTETIDPVGRETQITYATNGIDPLTVKQKTSASGLSTIAQATWNSQHLPLTYTDAAGQTSSYQYNPAGQLTQVTDALGETTGYEYDSLGYLSKITNANGQTQTSFTRDSLGRIGTATDSEGYAVSYAYDAFDRIVSETFPDQTTRQYAYTNLDLASVTDRQGKATQYAYDAVRNLVQVTDPLGNKTKFGYYENQAIKSITDPNGNTTNWNIDIENRVTGKQYADGGQIINTYENNSSRLKSITDALGQVKQLTYANDDSLIGIAYSKSVNPTPNVTFSYDPYFSRIASMTDDSGKTSYSYYPLGGLGALQLQKETTPFTNGTIAYGYDALGRPNSRSVDSSTETFAYDRLSRITSHGTVLGTFNFAYLGETDQLTSKQIATGTVGTSWAYDSNTNDRRLKAINNSGATRSFNYTTTPENLISQIQEAAPNGSAWAPKTWNYSYDDSYRLTQASSSAATYAYGLDPVDNITSLQLPSSTTGAIYNNLNQIASFGNRSYVYDSNGNTLDDGLRTYTWDAENRLLSITSKTNASQKTIFKYDGLGRRIAIDSGINAATEARYLWCGESLCQGRTASDLVTRRYYSEGEYLPLTGASLFYSQDQLGSVRDVLTTQNGSRVTAFDYDPYGNPMQSSGRVGTDFRYGGLFYDQQDGLYLTLFRAYDATTGRWISRDPLGEEVGPNLYSYVDRDPLLYVDPDGLGKVGFCIKTLKGVWKAVNRSRAEKELLEKGGDVLVSGAGESGKAKTLAKEVFGDKTVRHDPHSEGQLPHYQHKNGGRGHIFYGTLNTFTAVGLFGSNWFTNTVDFFNPVSDAKDLVDLYNDLDSPDEKDCNCQQP